MRYRSSSATSATVVPRGSGLVPPIGIQWPSVRTAFQLSICPQESGPVPAPVPLNGTLTRSAGCGTTIPMVVLLSGGAAGRGRAAGGRLHGYGGVRDAGQRPVVERGLDGGALQFPGVPFHVPRRQPLGVRPDGQVDG